MQTDATAVGCGTLPENLDEFLVRSPYVTVTKSSVPLLLLQAESDLRCPRDRPTWFWQSSRSTARPLK